MAENITKVEHILNELFKGRTSALAQYAKVRHTKYELMLWRQYGLPLHKVNKNAKAYFSRRFLGGTRIEQADEKTLRKGFETLDHAIFDGCHGRCMRLVKELNEALNELGLKPVKDPEYFLDWLTFCHYDCKDTEGNTAYEIDYGFPIWGFSDEENRTDFWRILKPMLSYGRIANMQYIAVLVMALRHDTVPLK